MHTRINVLLKNKPIDMNVIVKGWVRTRRDSKAGFSFLEINDGSCLKNIQTVADKSLSNYKNEILKITTGITKLDLILFLKLRMILQME